MNDEWNMVREFHEVASHPCPKSPQIIEGERLVARSEWMREEIDELLHAADICDQVDAIVDLIYFALGTLVEMGIPPKNMFKIVHLSNMAKLASVESTSYRADTKVEKPSSWVSPRQELLKEIDRVKAQSNS